MIKQGSKVKVHYVGTKSNGEEFDNSYKRGTTLDFEVGSGNMIKGFDNAVMSMTEGEIKKVTLSPSEAYGEKKQEAIMKVPMDNFPKDFNPEPGQMIQGTTQSGHPIQATVVERQEDGYVIDANHPLAGEELTFEIELLEVE